MPLSTCKFCGRQFAARNGRSKYCSGPCVRSIQGDRNKDHAAGYSEERRRAYSALQSALVNSALVRRPCEVCGRRKVDAHHDDYARPLEVRWLCRRHHREHHVQHGPGKNAFIDRSAA